MYLDQRTKKFLKVIALVAFVFVLAGCTANVDESGKLIAERAIDESTKWSLSQGFFDFFLVMPIAKGILFFGNNLGNIAYGVIIMTVLINIIMLPLMVKSTVSTQKLQMIQPEMERIQNKYKGRDDQQSRIRMSNEMKKLQDKHGISMFSSLGTFLTLPIMLAMWQAVQRIAPLYTTNFLGLQLGLHPMSQITSGNFSYLIIIILVGITQYFSIEINNIMLKRNPRYKPSAQQQQMKQMNIVMIVMIVGFSLNMATAMSLYWITTSIITIFRTIYIQLYHVENKK